jgi:hypothetical protein
VLDLDLGDDENTLYWFSSTMQEGVRVTTSETRDGDWYYVDIHATKEQRELLIKFFNKTRGRRYDWHNVLTFLVTPFNILNNEYYCFEWVYRALRYAGLIEMVNYNQKITAKTLLQLLGEK